VKQKLNRPYSLSNASSSPSSIIPKSVCHIKKEWMDTGAHFEENLSLDLGNLAAYDLNPVTEDQLDQVAASNAAALMKALAKLPREGLVITLPEPILVLPRAKSVPVPKPLTKWEKFRLANGLGRRRKRSRMVYEQTVDDFVPRWGPYSAKRIRDHMEIAKEEKDGEDQFEKASLVKAKDSARTKEKQIRNRMSARKELDSTLETAQRSTASRGKYDTRKSEPDAKKTYTRKPIAVAEERQKSLEILAEVAHKKRKSLQA